MGRAGNDLFASISPASRWRKQGLLLSARALARD